MKIRISSWLCRFFFSAVLLQTSQSLVPQHHHITRHVHLSCSGGWEAKTKDVSLASPSSQSSWAKNALLISSFTAGIVKSPDAQSFLLYSLASSLLSEQVRQAEASVRDSVMASPCNGPDIDAFNSLETYDRVKASISKTCIGSSSDYQQSAQVILQSFSATEAVQQNIRLLYIPTAMYALNPNSSNTPGKQRQRARADGKTRRNQVVDHVKELLQPHLPDTDVLAITLDLDDGSLKQPIGSSEDCNYPTDGVEAFTVWEPHIIYVEGGNTFWLQYCVEKGNWGKYIQSACTGPDATAVYIGKSAGAIIAGSTVETATWKGWDDPSIVPSKETYEHWKNHPGLCMLGPHAFFPHMTEDWEGLVEQKRQELEQAEALVCLRDFDACCVDGSIQVMRIASGSE